MCQTGYTNTLLSNSFGKNSLSSLCFKKDTCHPDLTIMVLLLTILFLLRKIPSGVPPKRGRSRETRVPGVGVINYSHWPTVVLVSLACSHVQIGTHAHSCSQPPNLGRQGQGPLSENSDSRGPGNNRDRGFEDGSVLGRSHWPRLRLPHRQSSRESQSVQRKK